MVFACGRGARVRSFVSKTEQVKLHISALGALTCGDWSVRVRVRACMRESRQLQYWFILRVCAGESLSSPSRGPGEQMAGSVKDEEKQLRQKIEGWDGTNSERHAWGTKESGVELRMAIVTPLRAVIFMIVVKIATNPTRSHCFLLVAYHYLWHIKVPPWAEKGKQIKTE